LSYQIKSNQFNSDTTGPYMKKKRKQTEKSADRQTNTHTYLNYNW